MCHRLLLRLGVALLWLSGGAVLAETWSHRLYDNGFRIYGYARSDQGLFFSCYGPSQGGKDMVSAGAHEDAAVPQGMLMINIAPGLIPLGNATQRSDFVLWVDGTGYRLPPVTFNELDGVWQVTVGMQDGLFRAMSRARDLIVAGGAQPWQFATDGLAEALVETMAVCNGAYAALPAAQPLRARAEAEIAQGCGGPFAQEPGAVQEALIDHDTMADVIVRWEAVSCQTGLARPFCGASHCSVWVYPSTRGGARDDLLAQAVSLIELSNGRMGLAIHAQQEGCPPETLGCERIWYWSGSGLEMLP